MLSNQLTKNELKRFYISYCPICGQSMKNNPIFRDIHYIKIRVGRSVAYRFFHTDCLLSMGKEQRYEA